MNDKFRTLEDLKKDGIEYLTKWIVLDKLSKFETIINGKLFATFPHNFNDSFDSQFRLTEDDKWNLARDIKCKRDKREFGGVIFDPHISSEKIYNELELQIEKAHCTNIACFSSLDQLKFESNHMWGLYANNGCGIALQYCVDSILECLNDQYHATNISDGFCDVEYVETLSQIDGYNFLKQIVEPVLISDPTRIIAKNDEHDIPKSVKKSVITLLNFFNRKSKEWQFEKEWRFISWRTYDLIEKKLSDERYLENPTIGKERYNSLKQDPKYSIFDFVKPSRIVFGWNNFENTCYYKELKNWAKGTDNDIECIELDKTVDYKKSQFNIKKI